MKECSAQRTYCTLKNDLLLPPSFEVNEPRSPAKHSVPMACHRYITYGSISTLAVHQFQDSDTLMSGRPSKGYGDLMIVTVVVVVVAVVVVVLALVVAKVEVEVVVVVLVIVVVVVVPVVEGGILVVVGAAIEEGLGFGTLRLEQASIVEGQHSSIKNYLV
uniref:Uncharacterized protein n=1 Tax=Glossina austeni TaxID=7395 RepID=A0A1A9V797_GLOAU